ncbi:Tetrathionate response regulatory protein TtrR [Pseudobythopirellula maris]|uniref:Tetrathionate response regulatory protein TtrR n=1 Tax=Pseudobythopirellula maris TaxID=2527991 RepID=A0A5C5ZTM2_9BACT|nr:LuxR C-terminal-related transcriptional regulator [Pseudobythopirellula maris]TWT90407.1 Tetrathionate response regulatory protein TtrR [Pseudobythopirellula maris]
MDTKPTVYVVDPDPRVRSRVALESKAWGMACEEFATMQDYALEASGNRPGCLVMENALPVGQDEHPLQQLRSRGDTTPVIAMTDEMNVSTVIECYEQGAWSVLEKPIALEKLRRYVECAIEFDTRSLEFVRRHQSLLQSNDALTDREKAVLGMIVSGRLNKSIANELDVSVRTVESVRASILRKYEAATAAELAAKATEFELLDEALLRVGSPIYLQYRNRGRLEAGQRLGVCC